jgi:hypothetical protein
MMRMIDRVVSVIGLRHCRDVVRGVVEIFSILRDRFSLTIPKVDSIHGLVDFEFTNNPGRDTIKDSEFKPFRDFSLGV